MKQPVDLTKWEKRGWPKEVLDNVQEFCRKYDIVEILYITDISSTTSKEYRIMYKDDGGHAGCEIFNY